MGISYDNMGYLANKNADKNKSNQSKKIGKKDKSKVVKKKRFHSTDINDNPNLIKKYNTKIENKTQENKKTEDESQTNVQYLTQNNNKLFKCLSYEKLQKIEEPNKTANPDSKYSHLYDGGKAHSSNPEINKQLLAEEEGEEDEEDIYNDMDDENSIEDVSDLNSNSNSASNKELQIINENMKTVFLSSNKTAKEEQPVTQNIIKEEKNNINLNNSVVESVVDYELNFYKTANEIRNSYIQKLVCKALYLPNNKPKTHNSLIIFDWDDTLLPTSFLTQGGVFNENIILSENDQKKIEKLEAAALNLLNMAITKGDVYIITNAGLGWVEYSANRFYPNIFEVLPKIQIISARGEWEKAFPGDSRKWKIQTFLSLEKRLNTKLVTNIICLGDSLFEIEAGRVLANCFREAFVKTIKFKEGPKLDELNKQLLLVANQFNSICSAVKNLTIRVEKKKK